MNLEIIEQGKGPSSCPGCGGKLFYTGVTTNPYGVMYSVFECWNTNCDYRLLVRVNQ